MKSRSFGNCGRCAGLNSGLPSSACSVSWCSGRYRRSSLPFCWPRSICSGGRPGPAPGCCRKHRTAVILSLRETDHAPDTSGIIIYRFGASLYFANATFFEEEVEKLVTQAATPVKWFVLDAEAMNDMDTTGEETLHQVLTWLAKRGVTVAVSRANQSTTALLSRYHLLELIGENRLYPTNRHAIAAFRRGSTGRKQTVGQCDRITAAK